LPGKPALAASIFHPPFVPQKHLGISGTRFYVHYVPDVLPVNGIDGIKAKQVIT